MSEQWKPVPEWEGKYEVSNAGEVRSLDRHVVRSDSSSQTIKGRPMSLSTSSTGYLVVRLSSTNPTRRLTARVHRLVASAFLPNPEGKPQVNHIDSDRRNNRVENLEWVNGSENLTHGYHHGAVKLPHRFGESANSAKLTEDQVEEIRSALGRGEPKKSIARRFAVSPKTIRRINDGETWSSAPSQIEEG